MALTNKLTAIADGFRASRGTTDKYSLDEMAVLAAEPTGGGESLPDEAFVITGSCNYRFSNNGWNWFIETYGDKITTKDISASGYMFYCCDKLKTIPFDINFAEGGSLMSQMFYSCYALEHIPDIDCKHTTYKSIDSLFSNCYKLVSPPKVLNCYPEAMNNLFNCCTYIREIPDDYFDTWTFDRAFTYKYSNIQNMFYCCHSLRKYPNLKVFNQMAIDKAAYANFYAGLFGSCYALDEIVDLPVMDKVTFTSSMFDSNSFRKCHRAKNITFETNDDGTPKVVNWKSQTIDLSDNIGYTGTGYQNLIVDYNSGITTDKLVSGANEYSALKDDPDWYTYDIAYSRYNHDSAVATINSLPDTSAYLATAGGTNTIKFKGTAGSNTDGGAINTLTEEEIAVATAKGWTVTFA